MEINMIKHELNGKSHDELTSMGYLIESQCGGEVAYIVSGNGINCIMIVHGNTFYLDEDSDIYVE